MPVNYENSSHFEKSRQAGKRDIHVIPAGHYGFLPPCSPQFAANSRPQVICPTDGVREILSSPLAKNILLLFFRTMW